MIRRILAILAAVLLVGTVALATLLASPDMPLGQALLGVDRQILVRLQSNVDAIFTHWTWTELVLPMLVRPAWLLPAALGLICGGLSLTLPSGRRAERPRQRRF